MVGFLRERAFALAAQSQAAQFEEKMIKKLATQIRGLQKELADIRKNLAILRFQPCLGDSEMREKEEKFDELEQRAKAINDSLRGTIRKRQLFLSQSAMGKTSGPPIPN